MTQTAEQYIRTGASLPPNRPGKPLDISALLALFQQAQPQQQPQAQGIDMNEAVRRIWNER